MVALHALATTLPRGVGARCGCLSGEGRGVAMSDQAGMVLGKLKPQPRQIEGRGVQQMDQNPDH